MQIPHLINLVMLAAFILAGCKSPDQSSVHLLPQTAPNESQGQIVHLPGESSHAKADSIQVTLGGMPGTVLRPGSYMLPAGSTVLDAVRAAGGLSSKTWWHHLSGMQRKQPDGSFHRMPFTRDRATEEKIILLDGDHIYFGHEVY